MTEKHPTRRRWFQFSLRTLLIVTMFVAFGGAWVGMQLQQKRRHEAVVNEIVKSGKGVQVGNDYDGNVPAWKEWLFGSYAVKPVGLMLSYSRASLDSILSQTQGMNLFILDLGSTNVTDAGLAHLNGLTSLKFLDLSDTQITDAGLTHLKGLSSLENCYLSDTQITDAGLTHLKGLNSLVELDLSNTKVTEAGMERLQKAIPDCEITY